LRNTNFGNTTQSNLLWKFTSKLTNLNLNQIFRSGESSGLITTFLATGDNLISGGYYNMYGELDQTSIGVQSYELEDELFEHTLKELIGNLDR
jgi:hypothetical protein